MNINQTVIVLTLVICTVNSLYILNAIKTIVDFKRQELEKVNNFLDYLSPREDCTSTEHEEVNITNRIFKI